jgi:hypothetical protein
MYSTIVAVVKQGFGFVITLLEEQSNTNEIIKVQSTVYEAKEFMINIRLLLSHQIPGI